MRPLLLLLLILPNLAACGYQMRGSASHVATSLSSVSVRAARANVVATQVRSQLQLSGVELQNIDSDYILSIETEVFDQSVLTVSAITGNIEEMQLTLQVRISAAKRNADTLFNNEMITVVRDYAYDESAVLGNDNEETAIRQDMARQAASRIIRRLNAASI